MWKPTLQTEQDLFFQETEQGTHQDFYVHMFLSYCRIERHIAVTLEAKMTAEIKRAKKGFLKLPSWSQVSANFTGTSSAAHSGCGEQMVKMMARQYQWKKFSSKSCTKMKKTTTDMQHLIQFGWSWSKYTESKVYRYFKQLKEINFVLPVYTYMIWMQFMRTTILVAQATKCINSSPPFWMLLTCMYYSQSSILWSNHLNWNKAASICTEASCGPSLCTEAASISSKTWLLDSSSLW